MFRIFSSRIKNTFGSSIIRILLYNFYYTFLYNAIQEILGIVEQEEIFCKNGHKSDAKHERHSYVQSFIITETITGVNESLKEYFGKSTIDCKCRECNSETDAHQNRKIKSAGKVRVHINCIYINYIYIYIYVMYIIFLCISYYSLLLI